jgi:hypothetical protein
MNKSLHTLLVLHVLFFSATAQAFDSFFFQENQDRIFEQAEIFVDQIETANDEEEAVKAALMHELKTLPFERRVDLQFMIISGFPDLLGLCIEGHPVHRLAIEGCASTIVLVSFLSLNIKYRWDVLLKQNQKGRINQVSVGPGIGGRRFTGCFLDCNDGWMGDLMGSVEYVYWLSHSFGLTLQIDAGTSYFLESKKQDLGDWNNLGDRLIPMGRLSFGFAF